MTRMILPTTLTMIAMLALSACASHTTTVAKNASPKEMDSMAPAAGTPATAAHPTRTSQFGAGAR